MEQKQSVDSRRILYTPSAFARDSLLHLQEVGTLRALQPHTSRREDLRSYLCFLVEEGEGQLSWEGEDHPLSSGDVVFIDCRRGYAHSTGLPGRPLWRLKWCHFDGPTMASIYEKYCQRGGSPVIRGADSIRYRLLLEELYAVAASNDYIRDMRINEKLGQLLTVLMETSWNREARVQEPRKMDIRRIKSYLDEHFREKITLESVAARFYVDKHYLARRFRAEYGTTVTQYIHHLRITEAKWMLRFTDKTVERIGLECGAGELTYFSRLFKKLEGMSPTEYRSRW